MSQPIIGRGRVLVFQFVPKTNNTIRNISGKLCWLDMQKFWRKIPKCPVQSEARVGVSNFESFQQITTPFQNPERNIFSKCGDFIWSSFWEGNWKYIGQTDARAATLDVESPWKETILLHVFWKFIKFDNMYSLW